MTRQRPVGAPVVAGDTSKCTSKRLTSSLPHPEGELDRLSLRPMLLDRAQASSGGLRAAVERRALCERAADRLDDRSERGLVELLAVARAGGTRDVLVHQGSA